MSRRLRDDGATLEIDKPDHGNRNRPPVKALAPSPKAMPMELVEPLVVGLTSRFVRQNTFCSTNCEHCSGGSMKPIRRVVQRPEPASARGVGPQVVAREADMSPTHWRQVGQKLIGRRNVSGPRMLFTVLAVAPFEGRTLKG